MEVDNDSRSGVQRSYLGFDETSVISIENSHGHITGTRWTQGHSVNAGNDPWRPRIVRLVAALALNHPKRIRHAGDGAKIISANVSRS